MNLFLSFPEFLDLVQEGKIEGVSPDDLHVSVLGAVKIIPLLAEAGNLEPFSGIAPDDLAKLPKDVIGREAIPLVKQAQVIKSPAFSVRAINRESSLELLGGLWVMMLGEV